MSYNWNIKLKTPTGSDVMIDTAARYGYYDRPSGAEGGGLWFEVDPSSGPGDANLKLRLTDYDGCALLPKSVFKLLKEQPNLIIEDEFDPEAP